MKATSILKNVGEIWSEKNMEKSFLFSIPGKKRNFMGGYQYVFGGPSVLMAGEVLLGLMVQSILINIVRY